ncbi:MAG: CvpA family protein [Firmicutes bacterium]|nr:CvpA family protein [Bacillota bacterium]
MNWLDFLLIFVALLSFFNGAKKGLVMQAFKLTGTVIAFFIAIKWSSAVGNWFATILPLGSFLQKRLSTLAPEQLFQEIIIPEELAVFQREAAGVWMSSTLLTLFGFVFIFFILMALLSVFCRIFKLVNILPVVGPLNVVGGGIFSVFHFLLVLFILISLASFFATEFVSDLLRSSAFIAIIEHFFSGLYSSVFDFLIRGLSLS